MTKIAIIGTGLCGLSVAHFLKDRAKITLFKKAWREWSNVNKACRDLLL
ncbi:MAG: NAD(P)-binding protein [Flavobacteriales bacterium]|nr:NAD(P)-binding protein [Flavobacteriales bacterium]